jgi:hypothetical protein
MHSSCHFVHSPLALSCFSVLQETLSMICVISRPRPSWMRSTPCFEAMETKKGRKNVYGSAASWEVTYFLSRTSCNSAASQVNDIQVVLSVAPPNQRTEFYNQEIRLDVNILGNCQSSFPDTLHCRTQNDYFQTDVFSLSRSPWYASCDGSYLAIVSTIIFSAAPMIAFSCGVGYMVVGWQG